MPQHIHKHHEREMFHHHHHHGEVSEKSVKLLLLSFIINIILSTVAKTLFGEAFNSKNGWSFGERLVALALSPVLDTSHAIGEGLKKVGIDLSDCEIQEWEIRTP